jgi:hypothetical protein
MRKAGAHQIPEFTFVVAATRRMSAPTILILRCLPRRASLEGPAIDIPERPVLLLFRREIQEEATAG